MGNWYHVNLRLLPYKLLYLLLYSADACIMPFFPLYLRQLRFTHSEVGTMYSITKFSNFFVQPMIGALVDKFQLHRHALAALFFSWGLTYSLFFVIPHRSSLPEPENACSLRIINMEHCGYPMGVEEPTMSCPETLTRALNKILMNKNASEALLICPIIYVLGAPKTAEVCLTENSYESPKHVKTCFANNTNFESHHNWELFYIVSESLFNESFSLGSDSLQNRNNKCYYLTDPKYINVFVHNYSCEKLFVSTCEQVCNPSSKSLEETSQYDLAFLIFAGTFLTLSVGQSGAKSLSNAVTYSVLGASGNAWGRQRLYGTLGYAIVAVTVAVIMDAKSKSQSDVDYSLTSYAFVTLCILAILLCFKLNISKDVKCSKFLTNVRQLLAGSKMLVFLIVMFCIGMMYSVNETFTYLFVKSLGAKQIVIGFSVVVACGTETILLFVSGNIIKKFGHLSCLYAACLAHCLRFVGLSVITNAWYAIPVVALHGVTYGVCNVAATSYMNAIAPRELVATGQGLLYGMNFALADYTHNKSLGAKQIVIGLSVVVSCGTETTLLFVSGDLIKKFGKLSCLYATCLAHCLRFVGLSVITNAWYALPVVALHGVTHSVSHVAATSYMNAITPRELVATGQGLLYGMNFALGPGVGNIIAGVMYDTIGARWTFRVYAVFALAVLCSFVLVNHLCFNEKDCDMKRQEITQDVQNDTGVNIELLNGEKPSEEKSDTTNLR